MNKRIGLLLGALALTAVAIFSGSEAQAGPRCNIACLVGHACCSNADCDAFCGGAGLGLCPGASSGGGCCVCVG
jgi:hypothetical protein